MVVKEVLENAKACEVVICLAEPNSEQKAQLETGKSNYIQ